MTELASLLQKRRNQIPLSDSESDTFLSEILDENCAPDEINFFLLSYIKSPPTVAEIVGFTRAMRKKMIKVRCDKDAIDVCGTGGTGKDRFNVSTVSAFVLSAMGIPVAKHGNVGSQKPNGSFDFLTALNIEYPSDPETCSKRLKDENLVFLFARYFHPALKGLGPIRKEIGQRTIFNILGPLCNPAQVSHQVVGVVNDDTAKLIAQALQKLESKRALVVVGGGGLDELSTTAPNKLYLVTKEGIQESDLDPKDLGLSASDSAILGKTGADNAKTFQQVFTGKIKEHPLIDIVALNAGAALYCLEKTATIEVGVQQAKDTILSGKLWSHYLAYARLPNR